MFQLAKVYKIENRSTEKKETREGESQQRVDQTRICCGRMAITIVAQICIARKAQFLLSSSAYMPAYTQTGVSAYVCVGACMPATTSQAPRYVLGNVDNHTCTCITKTLLARACSSAFSLHEPRCT